MAGLDVLRRPAPCAARSASSPRSPAPTARRRAARTSSSRARSTARAPGPRAPARTSCSTRFGLADAADRLARTYSGGMARRLDVALGLVHRPARCCSSTSPPPASTPRCAPDMWEEIARLSREEGITILLTTHYLEEADRLGARLAIVERGRVVARGDAGGPQGRAGAATPCRSSSPSPATAACRRRSPGLDRRARRHWSSGARCAPGPTTARAPCPPSSPRWRAAASASPPSPSSRPSLDDVYLRHAGRTFAEAERGDVRYRAKQGLFIIRHSCDR